MPIISNFPSGGGGGSGITLSAVKNIEYRTASQKIYIKWTDPEDLVDSSGSALATWAGTLLVRKKDSVPKSRRDGVVVIDSSVRNAYSEAEFCDNISLENESKYFYKFFPYTTEKAYTNSGDNNFDAIPDYIVIENEPIIKDDSFVYNGTEFVPEFIYDSDKVIISGTTSATDAGSYTTEFTPDEDHCWSDGSRETKTLVWVINKANSNISISPTEVKLVGNTESEVIKVNTLSDGEITAVSNDMTIATIEVNQDTKEVEIIRNSNNITGDTQVTISVVETKNYNTSSVTFDVNVSFELNSYSWDQISEISKSGRASECFQVGDTKTINIDGVDYEVRIIGFDHDTVVDSDTYGREKAGITFEMTGLLNSTYAMINTGDNPTWSNSLIRSALECMSIENEAVVVNVHKVGIMEGYYAFEDKTEDGYFILSEVEVYGENIYSHEVDSNSDIIESQYRYYAGDVTHTGGTILRSPISYLKERELRADDSTFDPGNSNTYNYYCLVGADGVASYTDGTAMHQISIAFCI